MLPVQEYLRSGKSLQDLSAELAIGVFRHPTLPLVALKYSMIDSPKTDPVVRSCRGTVLEIDTWEAVALSFRRFYNAGEDQENFQRFDWSDFTITTKEDGSLILLYHYAGEWHVNTSGSFGLGECNFSGKSWRELFWEASRIDRSRLDPAFTYIFEMWTPYNKVIRIYPQSSTFLLSAFFLPTQEEITVTEADHVAVKLGVPRPEHHHFTSMEEIAAFLTKMESQDRTYEGVVIRDVNGERYKVKSSTYLALHHLVDNGNLFNPKRLVPLILAGETDEVVAYIPQVEPHIEKVKARMESEFNHLLSLWRQTWEIESQREYAEAIVKQSPFTGLLFNLRRDLGSHQTEQSLRDKWRLSGDLIIKVLYG